MTGPSIIKTKANGVSAYVPTNVISITGGQIPPQPDLFSANQRPVVDVGALVSRVGGVVQVRAVKSVIGSLKINLTQYYNIQASTTFTSDPDVTSRQQLEHGTRLTELLRQGQYAPYPVEGQVTSVWARIQGYFNDIPVIDVPRFEQELLGHLRHNTRMLQTTAETKLFGDDLRETTEQALGKFRQLFRTSEGTLLVEEEYTPTPGGTITQKMTVRKKRG